jgi:hypothetical protein
MNKQQYADYERNIAAFLKRNAVKPGCHSPYYDEDGDTREPFFSWRRCECCRSHLGGDRETYQFACEDGSQFDADICVDCVYYLAYGVLDDMTMLEIERSNQPAPANGSEAA